MIQTFIGEENLIYRSTNEDMESAKVSIIIPAFTVENYIHRAIQSLINQTYKNIEIIIVDDGSEDNTWYVIQKLSKIDSRIKPIKQNNLGVSSARNTGLASITGDYLLFLDADDWVEENTVDILVKIANEYRGYLIAVDRNFVTIDRNGDFNYERQNKFEKDSKTDVEGAIRGLVDNKYNIYSACYKIFDANVIKKNNIRFDETIFFGEDGLFVFQYLLHSNGLNYRNIPLWNILDREGSATNGTFSYKWMTAIKATDKMLDTKNLPVGIIHFIKTYAVDRGLMLEYKILNSQANDKKLLLEIRRYVKKFAKEYLLGRRKIKRKIYFIIMAWFPTNIIKMIIRVKGRKT